MQQATTQETLVEASQLYTILVHVCMCSATSRPCRYHGLWHDRRFASQQLEHSSEEPVQQAPPMNVGESFAATALVHVCMCGLVLSIKFHHITCF